MRNLDREIPYMSVIVTLRRLQTIQLVERTTNADGMKVYVLTPEKCQAFLQRATRDLETISEEKKKALIDLEVFLESLGKKRALLGDMIIEY